MELETMLFGGAVIAFIAYALNSMKQSDDKKTDTPKKVKNKLKSSSNLISDENVTMQLVKDYIETLKFTKETDNYREKSIQRQLNDYLNIHFKHVQPQYSLEGNTSASIDFNIGRGKIGLELKLAKSIFRTNEFNRLKGQILHYTKAKFNQNNLLILVAGEKKFLDNRVQLNDIRNVIESLGADFLFVEVE